VAERVVGVACHRGIRGLQRGIVAAQLHQGDGDSLPEPRPVGPPAWAPSR
jgi:hypothetical protein